MNLSKTTFIAEPGTQEIRMVRDFDAPRDLIYKTCTDPRHVPNWWGPRRLTTIVDKMDVKVGGIWRYVQHDKQGNEFAFHGVFHEVTTPERLVFTFEFEGMPGHVILQTTRFEALPGGKTRLTDSSIFQSVEDRDGMLSSGMQGGAEETWERLAELLTTL